MNIQSLLSRRSLYFVGFVLPLLLLATGIFYFQHQLDLAPCPLCIIQRGFLIAVSLLCLLAFVHNPREWGNKVYGLGGSLIALGGASVSARHVYIQSLPPDQLPGCGPGLDYMLEVFPLSEIVNEVFRGSGECADVLWQFLGLTIPGWTFVVFIGIATAGAYQAFRRSA